MSKPDWDGYWLRLPRVKVWQACALSLDIEPREMKTERGSWMGGSESGPHFQAQSFPTETAKKEFEQRLDLTTANLFESAHFRTDDILHNLRTYEVYLSDFARWAVHEMKWKDLPPKLEALGHTKPTGDIQVRERSHEMDAHGIHGNRQPSTGDWREMAMKIADELFDHDTKSKIRDSLDGYSRRVMEEMQTREIHGPRGRFDNANTIKREALQGSRWWANKKK